MLASPAAQEPETSCEVAGRSGGSALRAELLYGQEGFKMARGGASAAAVNVGFRVLRAIGERW